MSKSILASDQKCFGCNSLTIYSKNQCKKCYYFHYWKEYSKRPEVQLRIKKYNASKMAQLVRKKYFEKPEVKNRMKNYYKNYFNTKNGRKYKEKLNHTIFLSDPAIQRILGRMKTPKEQIDFINLIKNKYGKTEQDEIDEEEYCAQEEEEIDFEDE